MGTLTFGVWTMTYINGFVRMNMNPSLMASTDELASMIKKYGNNFFKDCCWRKSKVIKLIAQGPRQLLDEVDCAVRMQPSPAHAGAKLEIYVIGIIGVSIAALSIFKR